MAEQNKIGIIDRNEEWRPRTQAASTISLLSEAEMCAIDLGSSVLGIRHIVFALTKERTTRAIFERLNVNPDELQKRLQLRMGIKSNSMIPFDPNNLPEPTKKFITSAEEQGKGLCAEKTRAVDFLLAALTSGSGEGKTLLEILKKMIPDKEHPGLIKRIETLGQTIDPEPAGVK